MIALSLLSSLSRVRYVLHCALRLQFSQVSHQSLLVVVWHLVLTLWIVCLLVMTSLPAFLSLAGMLTFMTSS